jgi:hypothetical protein
MATTIESYLTDGIISFAFPKIDTYTNERGEIKKKPIGMPNWRTINKLNCLHFNIGSAYAVVTGEASNLTIFDFDSKADYERLVLKHPDLKKYKTIKTNKGFHIWFTYNPDYKTTVDCFNDYKGVDIRNDAGIVFCPPTKYALPDGSIVEYVDLGGTIEKPPDFLKSYIKTTPITQLIQNKPSGKLEQDKKDVTKNEIVDKLLYLGLLDGKAQGAWDEWRNVALCMRWITTFEHFDFFSKINKSKYDKKETIDLWNSIREKYEAMNLGTLFSYAKEYNKDKYNLYFNYYISVEKMTKGALTIAECISPKLERHLKWSNDKWFMFYKKTNLWIETKEPSHIIVQMIHKHIDYSIQIKINERNKIEDTDQQKRITDDIKTYSKMYSEVDKSGFYSMITKHLKTILYDSEFYYKLDNNPYKIAFQDGIYDLRENKFNKGYSDYDYITKTIPFEYKEPTYEQTEFVKNVIFKICNCNKSHFDYYLGVLGQALLGDAELEKALYFCVGVGGNNGKTLILEALADIMPNYVSKIERKTFEKGYTKAHKHLAGTKGKRIVYVEELSTKEQEIELLKEIADGKNIKNEIMFGTDELINIMFKLVFLSNCQANMKVDGGIGNRYRQLCHNSKFNKETTEDNYETLDFIQDKTLAGLLKGDYKHALIQLFLDAGHNYTKTNNLIIPNEFQEAITNTLEANDEVKMWFDENCEYGDDFKCSKFELEKILAKSFREIQTEIQRITNFKYDRRLTFGKTNRGGFKGFRIKEENSCMIDVDLK